MAAQVVPLLVTPWLTRLYGPAEYGIFGVFFAIVMTVSLIASGRYEMAVPVVGDDDEAARLLVGSIGVLIAFTVVTILIALALTLFSGLAQSRWAVWAGGAFILSAGILQSCSYWFTRFERYHSLSATRITLALVAAVSSVALGYYGHSAVGLAVGATLGQAAGAIVAVALVWRSIGNAWEQRSRRAMLTVLASHAEFPRVNAPHALVDGLRETGFQVLFAAGFGAAATGFYGLAVRVLRAPAAFIGAAMSQVLFGRLSRDNREQRDSRGLLLKVIGLLALVSAPVFLLIALFGPPLFGFIFGPQWVVAGEYARIMSPALWLAFAVAPAATLPVVAGRMRGAFGFALTDLGLRLVALTVGYVMRSAEVALVCMSFTSVCTYLALLWWYSRLAAGAPSADVVFIGQSRWSGVLRDQLTASGDAAERVAFHAVPLERPWSVFRPSSIAALISADVLVRVGFRPGATTPFGRLFDAAWRVLLALRPKARPVMYWIGTDVMNTAEALRNPAALARFKSASSGMTHLAASQGLVDELALLGVESRLAWFPALTLNVPTTPPPYPERFTVLSYVPDARASFYGGPDLVALARALPDVLVRIVGGAGAWVEGEVPPNMTFVGWVEDMGPEYELATVVTRLVEHDALGATAIEGVLYGRGVVYTGELQHAQHVPFGDLAALCAVISVYYARWQSGDMAPDLSAAQWARKEFSQQERIRVLLRELGLDG